MTDRRSSWLLGGLTLAAIGLLLGVPFILRPASARLENPLELIIVSPHDEAVKIEFARAFSDWHQAKFGRPVRIVWPNIGGTGDITRYVESNFAPQFRRVIGNTPSDQVNWLEVDRPGAATRPDELTERARALRDVGVKIDLFFGAGDYEHKRFKKNGWLARCDLPSEAGAGDGPAHESGRRDDYLSVVPPTLNGQPLYDTDHYWYGAVITRLGIIANNVVCRKLGLAPPRTWADLAQPCFRDQLALADPNFSGSAKLCYEMVLQSNGWEKGWRILTEIAANARYFGSGSTQVALDVSRCEAAAGMIIDYYGRTQVDYVGKDPATGEFRLAYFSPEGATASTPDPIAIFRGAPHRDLAEKFVQFVLSVDGQKLWMGKIENDPNGGPLYGGPQKFQLYRPPIRPDIYRRFAQHMIRPATATAPEDPFTENGQFNINGAMQNRRFGLLGVLMRAALIDNADLLRRAADYARSAAPDSPARREFDALPFPEGDPSPGRAAPGSMWALADAYKDAARETDKEKIAADLTTQFRDKYRHVLISPR